MNQVVLVAAVIITLFCYVDGKIQCYKCTTTKPSFYSNETVRLCSDFDYSEKFIVDCEYSTFCMKRYYTARISGQINATERDCAPQKQMTQNLKNGRWHPTIVVEEAPYQEGCNIVDDKGARTSITMDCFCKSYLCNTSNINGASRTAVIIIITILISLM